MFAANYFGTSYFDSGYFPPFTNTTLVPKPIFTPIRVDMNYTEIKDLVLGYSDRQDAEVIDNIPNFTDIVESRINRALKIRDMIKRATISIVAGQQYYGLPEDFDGLRDIEIQSATGGKIVTLGYYSPEQMNNRANLTSGKCVYTIIANQIQIYPPQEGATLEITYYQRLVRLVNEGENWLSKTYPDAYVFGLMVEINAFVKDAEGAAMWDLRFNQSLQEIEYNDSVTRWSGTPLQVGVG